MKKRSVLFFLTYHELIVLKNILFIVIVISQILSANCNIFFNGFVAVNNSVI